MRYIDVIKRNDQRTKIDLKRYVSLNFETITKTFKNFFYFEIRLLNSIHFKSLQAI